MWYQFLCEDGCGNKNDQDCDVRESVRGRHLVRKYHISAAFRVPQSKQRYAEDRRVALRRVITVTTPRAPLNNDPDGVKLEPDRLPVLSGNNTPPGKLFPGNFLSGRVLI